ncbi:MAG: glycosyl transferase group 1, partial [uncultured bacterium]
MTLRQAQSHSEFIESMKVALVYDRVNKWGGAERVLLALHKMFPRAPLFTSVYNEETAGWAGIFDIKTSFLQSFPLARRKHELYATFMPLAFESLSFDGYDLVISLSSEASKGIITKPGTCHICYCLTPTRYLWSGYGDYFKNPLLRFLSKPAVSYLKSWDLVASQRPDYYASISKEVAGRVRKYYGRDSIIIYPPVAGIGRNVNSKKEDFYLLVSRPVPYKRIDIAIEVFKNNGKKLKIVGAGLGERFLKGSLPNNIEVLGDVSDEALFDLYQRANALIFPGREDFGLVMAEAQSFGTPVVAFGGGGALEIIEEGRTGEFFNKHDSSSLQATLEMFDKKSYNSEYIKERALRFGPQRFEKEFLNFVENSL